MTAFRSPSFLLSHLEALYAQKGGLQYGEDVTQLQHALQCGALAEQAGASDALVLAAVLHDVGHMLHWDAAQALERMEDDSHEDLTLKILLKSFDLITDWSMPNPRRPNALAFPSYAFPRLFAISSTLFPVAEEMSRVKFNRDCAETTSFVERTNLLKAGRNSLSVMPVANDVCKI